MLKSKKKALALAVLCAVSSMGLMSIANAEEVSEPDSTAQKENVENNFTLNEMVVTATRTMKELKEVPSSVSVITAKEIEEKNVTSVQEALQHLPGVYMSQAAQGGLQLRGFSSSDVLVLVDGVQMNDTYGGDVNFNMIPVENIERIEVLRGAASSIYGGHAVGGVINIITKEPEEGTHVNAALTYGSNNTWKKALSLNSKVNDKWSFGLGYENRKSDGYHGYYNSASGKSGTGNYTADLPVLSDGKYIYGGRGDKDWEHENYTANVKYNFDESKSIKYTYSKYKTDFSYKNPFTYVRDANGNPVWSGNVTTQNGDIISIKASNFYGYDNIPTTLPKGEATTGKLQFHHRVENVAKDIAEFCGFSQGMNYSFESPKVFDKLLIPEDSVLRQAIRISNPLGDDFSIMRTTSLNGMLSSLGYNYSHRNKDVRLYELANIYLPKALPLTELPDERMQFTLGMYGSGDFFVMKGVVEEFLEKAGMHKIPQYDPNAGQPSLHPGRQANILYDGEVIGFLGEVHPQVLDNYGIGEKAYVAVLDMPKIVEKASFDRKYEGIPKFPAVTRDLSMVVPKHVLAGEIEEMIVQRGGKHLESFKLFDIYEGTQIKEGYKSMAYSVVFRAKDKTMEEAEITTVMKKILNGLESMGIELRQ